MAPAVHEAAAREFQAQRDFLWGLCYRLTGSAADADAVVEEAFVRVLERPPATDAWRPVLARAAAARSIDLLRLRRHRAYVGPWLPSPVETGDAASSDALERCDGEPSYDEVESLTLPFLLQLEALTPRQRAVLVLRAVCGCTVAEAAHALDLTFGTVKTTLREAARMMSPYEARRVRPTRQRQRDVARTVRHLFECIQRYDAPAIASLLSPSARALSDAGGEFVAPTTPLTGRERIAKQLLKLAERGGPTRFAFRMLNGLPALLAEVPAPAAWAQRFVFQIDVNADGRIDGLFTILATRKLAAIRFEPA